MIGGYINCINGKWTPINNQNYNVLEAAGLNELGICFHGQGTDKYDLNPRGNKLWYFKNNSDDKYTLIDIIDELKTQILSKNKIKNTIKPAYNNLFNAYNMREKVSYKYENKDGKITTATKNHQKYYNKLYNFLLHLENESDYIDRRIEIANISKTRNKTRSRTRSRSRSRSRIKSRSSSKKRLTSR
tara:strand:+ start:790 stop:1350 length:561 start_codon:yes stop_codon:yes gene_type:complete